MTAAEFELQIKNFLSQNEEIKKLEQSIDIDRLSTQIRIRICEHVLDNRREREFYKLTNEESK